MTRNYTEEEQKTDICESIQQPNKVDLSINAETEELLNKNIIISISLNDISDYMSMFTEIATQLETDNLQLITVKSFLDFLSSHDASDSELNKIKLDLDASILNLQSQL